MLSTTLVRLDAACKAIAPIDGVAVLGTGQAIEAGWFVVKAPWGVVRVDGNLTPAQQAALTTAINAFSPNATVTDNLEQFGGRGEAAMLLKASTQWAALTAPQQAAIQAVIDQWAAKIIQALS